ncbi:MAG: hypothetical protein QF805_29775, partial [Pirellulaceae bacterium]|nr:hypothetical protein [Pirellulaceae bacterium]
MATAPSRDTDETSVVVTAPSSEEESSLERTTALPLTEMPTAAQEDIEFEPAPVSHKIIMAFAVVLPFIGCIAAIVHLWQYGLVNWLYIGMLVGGWVLTGMGITIGFHRMLTHRSFET